MSEFIGYKRGINLGGWLSQCSEYSEEHYSDFIKQDDIAVIADWGLDHVRLPVDYNVIEDEERNSVESGLRHIDDCISWCRDRSLNVVIDLHKTKGYFFDDGDKNTLFENRELQNRFISLWKRIAERYGKETNVSFELMNEVGAVESESWNSLAAEAISEIRKIAPNTPIIVGGTCWNSAGMLKFLHLGEFSGIVYNFHFYEPMIFTHQLAYWQPLLKNISMRYHSQIEKYRETAASIHCFDSGLASVNEIGAEFMNNLISEAVTAAKNAGVPLYCGEYGVIDQADISDTADWYRDVHSVFEKYDISRAAWTYKEMDFGITQKHYESEIEGIIANL